MSVTPEPQQTIALVVRHNTAGIDDMPHGGYKDSGTGREFGQIGMEEFQELKTVQILLG